MIVRPRLHWLRMLFVWRGSILKQVLPQLVVVLLYAIGVTALLRHEGWHTGLNTVPFSLLGLAIAIFLGFRNNASYERFWEARKLWGALVIESRTAARQLCTVPDTTPGERARLVRLVIGFAHALRLQLRGTSTPGALAPYVLEEGLRARVEGARCKPALILLGLSEELAGLRRRGKLEPILAASFEPVLAAMSGILGGCERIANTPIPFTYSVIIHRVIYLYAFLLPFGLVEAVGWWTPVMVAFNAYMFFTLEALAHEIEEPFGTMPNDLALDSLCHAIESSLLEMLGEAGPADGPKPVDYVIT